MSKKHKKKILSFLENLMMHIIKWKNQPDRRSKSWIRSINFSRKEILDIQDDFPSITDDFINDNWDKALQKAIKKAENEMQQPATKRKLTWDEVFINKYTLLIMFVLVVSGIFIMFK